MTPAIWGLALNGLVEFPTRETTSFRHHFTRFLAAVAMSITMAVGGADGADTAQVVHASTVDHVTVE
jgi:hypothetical protein